MTMFGNFFGPDLYDIALTQPAPQYTWRSETIPARRQVSVKRGSKTVRLRRRKKNRK